MSSGVAVDGLWRAAHGHAVALRGGEVDGGVGHAGGDQQAQVGQPLETLGGEGGAFAHRDDHVELVQGLDHGVGVRQVLVEEGDFGVQACQSAKLVASRW